MTSYTNPRNKLILRRIIEVIKQSETDLDGTITITETDFKEILRQVKITDFNFNHVAGLKKVLSFENYKIIFKDIKVLKVEREREIQFTDMPEEYI
ncbi:hypothetical protein EZS27_026377 [termite gut metagenome]|uniref:Uncharacterized protein n=1 Tax=termite gut metagenome TaxID=433724 RepID=A0A5J4QQQ1_9ZZZZ